jgi:hypothetical protein
MGKIRQNGKLFAKKVQLTCKKMATTLPIGA